MNIPQNPRSRRGVRSMLVALWVFTLALIAFGAYLQEQRIEESRSGAFRNAERDLANLTRVSQEHANRTLRSADQVIRFVVARYAEVGNKLDLPRLTEQGVIDSEIFNQVGIIDSEGMYALSDHPIRSRLDLSDREHFRVHKNADSGTLFVSSPVVGRTTQKWSVQLTRRINRGDGTFGGVVVVSIDPGYFTRFYKELNLGKSGVSALYRTNGIALARRVGDKEEFGGDAGASSLFGAIASGSELGSYVQRSVVDGVERMYYYRKVPGYELVTVAGFATEDLLAEHAAAKQVYLMQGLISASLMLALALAISWHFLQIRTELRAREKTQDRLQERTELLNAILELSPDGLVSFDRSGTVRFVNAAFCRITALESATLLGLNERDFSALLAMQCAPSTPFMGLAQLRLFMQEKPGASLPTVELGNPVGRTYQTGVSHSSADAVAQILYLHDVTLEAEIDQMKSDFLATAAHELRTPMASVFGFSEVLLTQKLDAAEQREMQTIVHEQAGQMSEILNELLDLARIEARRGKDFKFSKVGLQPLLLEQSKSLKLPAGRTAPSLEAPADTIYIEADANKLKQALNNVLSNAYKYSPGGGAVEVTLQKLPATAGAPARVQIEVSDYGMGMTPEQVDKVFDRFYRADSSGKIPGTGLGMSIVKEIVELHHGSVKVTSASGQGTTVAMVFPASASAA